MARSSPVPAHQARLLSSARGLGVSAPPGGYPRGGATGTLPPMAIVDIRRLSLAIDREASLFERESDLSAFLQDCAGMVVRAGQAKLCAVYVLDRARDVLALRATAGAGEDLPDQAGPGHSIDGAVRARRVTRLANRNGSTRFVFPITRGPDRIGALVIDRAGPVDPADESGLRSIASR